MNDVERMNALERFGLRNGQYFGQYALKNLQWTLNGEPLGFGDLRHQDIGKIEEAIKEGEVFRGFNEHHKTRFMQRENPMIVIVKGLVNFPAAEHVKSSTYALYKDV